MDAAAAAAAAAAASAAAAVNPVNVYASVQLEPPEFTATFDDIEAADRGC